MREGRAEQDTSLVGEISGLNYSSGAFQLRKIGTREVNFFVPEERLEELKKLRIKTRKIKAVGASRPAMRALIYLLHCCHIAPYVSDNSDGWARISSKYMEFICNDRRTWAAVRSALVAHGVIECDNKARRGEKSYGYRLTAEWLKGVQWKRTGCILDWPEVTDGWREISYLGFDRNAAVELLDRIYRMRREVPRFKKRGPAKGQAKLSSAKGSKMVWVESTWDQTTYEAFLWRIENFRKSYRICGTGRLFTDANTIPKELRSLVTIMGEATVELDVANCQPLLLWTLYPQESVEAFRYRKLAESGKLYEAARDAVLGGDYEQMKETLLESERVEFERNNFKNRYFVPFLFGEGAGNRMKPKIEGWLAKEFPEILAIIRNFLLKGPKALPRALQKMESDLIWKAVDAAGIPHLSVHDGVRVRERDLAVARAVLEQSFSAVGLSPRIEVSDVLAGLQEFENKERERAGALAA